MNLAVHGLSGDIKQSNSYDQSEHNPQGRGKFDFVMANPPFNVNGVDKEKIKGDPRFSFGLPKHRQCQLSVDPGVLQRAKSKGPRRIRDGQLCQPMHEELNWKSERR